MFELTGKYNTAKVFTDNVDDETISQVINILNQPFTENEKIRIMPDTHAGADCVIGYTQTVTDKIVPNLVSGDIGCGMLVTELEETADKLNLDDIDFTISQYVPNGFEIHTTPVETFKNEKMFIADIDATRARLSLGTLGGGNHYIEINEGTDGKTYLVIHTGSRHLGQEVCKYWQDQAIRGLKHRAQTDRKLIIKMIVEKCTAEGRKEDIDKEIKALTSDFTIPEKFAYLEGIYADGYIQDMKYAQAFAKKNRETIADIILRHTGLHAVHQFDTIHNYLDTENRVIRKGAISAEKDEIAVIPINMRDGSLIIRGKGNPDWNNSAPHGAGRVMSRSQAKANITLEEFERLMSGIYTTSVCQSTIDESPMVYKPMDEIIENIEPTAEVLEIIKPIYNFKAH